MPDGDPSFRVAAIVLAAGRSTRMGRPKALLPYRGRTFLGWIATAILEAPVDALVLVRSARGPELAGEVPPDSRIRWAINPNPDAQQIDSLAVGLASLGDEFDAAFACLVDHPAVSASTYVKLIESLRAGSRAIVVPTCGGRRGHPPLFRNSVFAELARSRDAGGARGVIRRDPSRVLEVETGDPGILADIDTPEDYDRLRGEWT